MLKMNCGSSMNKLMNGNQNSDQVSGQDDPNSDEDYIRMSLDMITHLAGEYNNMVEEVYINKGIITKHEALGRDNATEISELKKTVKILEAKNEIYEKKYQNEGEAHSNLKQTIINIGKGMTDEQRVKCRTKMDEYWDAYNAEIQRRKE